MSTSSALLQIKASNVRKILSGEYATNEYTAEDKTRMGMEMYAGDVETLVEEIKFLRALLAKQNIVVDWTWNNVPLNSNVEISHAASESLNQYSHLAPGPK